MIDKDIITVYAQYHEDIIIASLLPYTKKGFYVDVGANHETYHSVTKYFYERGWHGINIEPNQKLLSEIKKTRKRDINICAAASDHEGYIDFREYPEQDGFSTASKDSMQELDQSGFKHIDYRVKVRTLKSVFKEHKVQKIDFIKIDVEGYEAKVIKGNDWIKYHPTLVCVEANHGESDWSKLLLDSGYELVINDGLNDYFLSKDAHENMVGFADRASLMAHNAVREHHIKSWNNDINDIKNLREFSVRQDSLIKKLSKDSSLSLNGKSFISRLKVVVKGLTLDYIKYRRKK